jgi:hypothetical protein
MKDQVNMLKYELKEKDMDIVELQKEINELQIENKMYKSKLTLLDDHMMFNVSEEELKSMDTNNPFVIIFHTIRLNIFHIIFHHRAFKKIKEMISYKREKECALEELMKAQDTIAQLKLEKSTKSIECYDANNVEILHKKLSKIKKKLSF